MVDYFDPSNKQSVLQFSRCLKRGARHGDDTLQNIN